MPAVPASSTTSTVRLVEAAGLAAVDRDQQPGDRGRGDAGGHRQLVGGDAGVGGADHAVAGALPCVAGGGEGERLAGAAWCGEDVDAVAGRGHLDHRPDLFLRQAAAASRERGDQLGLGADAALACRGAAGGGEGAPFDVEQLERRPALLRLAARRSSGPTRHGSPRPGPGRRSCKRRGLASRSMSMLGEFLDPLDRRAGRERVAPALGGCRCGRTTSRGQSARRRRAADPRPPAARDRVIGTGSVRPIASRSRSGSKPDLVGPLAPTGRAARPTPGSVCLARRVSSAAIIAAFGECWLRIAIRSSISARRVENALSTVGRDVLDVGDAVA